MLRSILLATILAAAIAPAAAYSNAANYLIAEQIASACEGNVGEIDPGLVIERDLTGDGKADLILSHEGINCSAAASTSRSSFCGVQICAVNLYVRRGALLELKTEMLGAGVSVGEGHVPESECTHMGAKRRRSNGMGEVSVKGRQLMRAGMPLWICFCLIPLTSQAAAIHDAAKKGDMAAITAALDAGANVNDPDGFATPLYYAVSRQHLDAAKLLIDRGADVNTGSKIGGPPLKVAVAKNKLELITLLLAHGADPNSAVGDQTVLHEAVRHGCLDCVKALVEAGADVSARTADSFARTPLHLARFNEYSEISDYLVAHGATLPKPAPIATNLAAAAVEKGRIYFGKNCDGCHNNDPGKGSKTGPNLWEVVGRDKASVPEFNYSKTLRDWEGAWTYEDLNTFLYDPVLTTPGVRMEIPGVPDETERVNLIAYLRTLSDKPIPLP